MSEDINKEKKPTVNKNAWMVTFGDLIMLLLTFFVMLLTMKSMEKRKTEEMFKNFINSGEAAWDFGFKTGDERKNIPEISGEKRTFVSSSAILRKTLKHNYYNFRKNFVVTEDDRGIVVTIDSENLFNSGEAKIKQSGLQKLNMVGEMLQKVTNTILILGHTDNIPLRSGPFRSNWDLSCYRALNVFYYFVEEFGLPTQFLAPGGYGDTRPLLPNTSDENRSKNRRIEFILKT